MKGGPRFPKYCWGNSWVEMKQKKVSEVNGLNQIGLIPPSFICGGDPTVALLMFLISWDLSPNKQSNNTNLNLIYS